MWIKRVDNKFSLLFVGYNIFIHQIGGREEEK
jgi:hypothetical protein